MNGLLPVRFVVVRHVLHERRRGEMVREEAFVPALQILVPGTGTWMSTQKFGRYEREDEAIDAIDAFRRAIDEAPFAGTVEAGGATWDMLPREEARR